MANDLSVLKRAHTFSPSEIRMFESDMLSIERVEKEKILLSISFQWAFESHPSYYKSIMCYSIFF